MKVVKSLSIVNEYIEKLEEENKQLKEKINKALHKLKSSVNHFKTQRENNAVTFTIRILEGKNE